jgi:hypothetical protein
VTSLNRRGTKLPASVCACAFLSLGEGMNGVRARCSSMRSFVICVVCLYTQPARSTVRGKG